MKIGVHTLKPHHFRLLQELLDRLSDYQSAAGCNDFDLEKFGLSRSDMDDMCREFHEFNGDPEEYEAGQNIEQLRHSLPDFCVTALLAHKFQQLGQIFK